MTTSGADSLTKEAQMERVEEKLTNAVKAVEELLGTLTELAQENDRLDDRRLEDRTCDLADVLDRLPRWQARLRKWKVRLQLVEVEAKGGST